MDWFRVYTEARKDPKLAVLTDAQHRVWFNLLCLAGEREERENRGVVPAMPRYLLAVEVSRADEALLNETLTILARLRIIAPVEEDGAVEFLAWKKRQYETGRKPSETPEKVAERVQKHRDAKRSSQGNTPVTPCNAPVTPPDTESETEAESVSTARERHGHLAGVREGTATAEWAAGDETPPVPDDTDPFDGRDAKQQQETAARQEAGRRNQPITALFVAFRRGKWPHKSAEWHETYPNAELREAFETLRALHQDGVTPEQMQKATERCLVEYSNPTRVTVDAIARAWTTLTEPPSKVIGGKPPGPSQSPANGQQSAPRSARRLVQ